ncbi:MAG: hypothetical protein KBG14_00720 [Bacteroidales bacterium]|nr:hypothetical protein [Bacteroidales bacterium]
METKHNWQIIINGISTSIGIILMSIGLKDISYTQMPLELYSIGASLVIFGLIINQWYSLSYIKLFIGFSSFFKFIDLLLIIIGSGFFTYGIKNTDWDASNQIIIGGIFISIAYFLRIITLDKNREQLSLSSNILKWIFFLSILTFLSSIYLDQDYQNSEIYDIKSKLESIEYNVNKLTK